MTATVDAVGRQANRAASRHVHLLVIVAVSALILDTSACSFAPSPGTFAASLTSTAQTEAVEEAEVIGEAAFTFDGSKVDYVINLDEVPGLLAAHLHHEPTRLVVVTLVGIDTPRGDSGHIVIEGTFTQADLSASSPVTFEELVRLMRTGHIYVNAHTQANPGGAIRGVLSAAAPNVSRSRLRAAAAEESEELPGSMTAATVEEGHTIFHGGGLCSTCHGENGAGTPLAPSLSDAEWLNIDGSLDAITQLISLGVPEPKQHVVPMAPRGGSQITDDELRAVAAYVWSLCRTAAQEEGRPTESCGP